MADVAAPVPVSESHHRRVRARRGFTESWPQRLERVGLAVSQATLSINCPGRRPEEVMAEAKPVIRAVFPDANVPTSVRGSGVPVGRGSVSDLGSVLDSWLAEHADGIACVIGSGALDGGTIPASSRVRYLTPSSRRDSSSTWSSSSTRTRSATASKEPSTATSR